MQVNPGQFLLDRASLLVTARVEVRPGKLSLVMPGILEEAEPDYEEKAGNDNNLKRDANA